MFFSQTKFSETLFKSKIGNLFLCWISLLKTNIYRTKFNRKQIQKRKMVVKPKKMEFISGTKRIIPLSIPFLSLVILHFTMAPWGVGSKTNASKLSSMSAKTPMPGSSSPESPCFWILLPAAAKNQNLKFFFKSKKNLEKWLYSYFIGHFFTKTLFVDLNGTIL